jgi:hypothetical protein
MIPRKLSVCERTSSEMIPRKLSACESNFWLNLSSLIEKRGSKKMGSEEESEKINNWLQALLKSSEKE